MKKMLSLLVAVLLLCQLFPLAVMAEQPEPEEPGTSIVAPAPEQDVPDEATSDEAPGEGDADAALPEGGDAAPAVPAEAEEGYALAPGASITYTHQGERTLYLVLSAQLDTCVYPKDHPSNINMPKPAAAAVSSTLNRAVSTGERIVLTNTSQEAVTITANEYGTPAAFEPQPTDTPALRYFELEAGKVYRFDNTENKDRSLWAETALRYRIQRRYVENDVPYDYKDDYSIRANAYLQLKMSTMYAIVEVLEGGRLFVSSEWDEDMITLTELRDSSEEKPLFKYYTASAGETWRFTNATPHGHTMTSLSTTKFDGAFFELDNTPDFVFAETNVQWAGGVVTAIPAERYRIMTFLQDASFYMPSDSPVAVTREAATPLTDFVLPPGATAEFVNNAQVTLRLHCDAGSDTLYDVIWYRNIGGVLQREKIYGSQNLSAGERLLLKNRASRPITFRFIKDYGKGNISATRLDYDLSSVTGFAPKLTVNLRKKLAAEASAAPGYNPVDFLSSYDITLYNVTAKKQVTPEKVRDAGLYYAKSAAAPGDVLRLSLTHKKGDTLPITAEATVGSDRCAELNLLAVQKGYARIPYTLEFEGATRASRVYAAVYNAAGELAGSAQGTNGTVVTPGLDAGSYKAVLIATEMPGWEMPALSGFAEKGLVAGQDYLVLPLIIRENVITVAGIQNVPACDGSKLSHFDQQRTGFAVNTASVQVNGLLEFTLRYALKDAIALADVEAMRAVVQLPAALSLEENSLLLNGAAVSSQGFEYNASSGKLAVELAGRSGVLKFHARPTAAGSLTATASLALDFADGSAGYEEPAGSCAVSVPILTLHGSSVVDAATFTVSGVAPSLAQVNVYSGETLVGAATASYSGKWSAEVDLGAPRAGKAYTLVAKTGEGAAGEAASNPLGVRYQPGHPRLTQVLLHHSHRTYNLTNAMLQGTRPLVTVIPSRVFTFEITFTQPEQIGEVLVISDRQGDIRQMEAHYDGAGKWVASGYFDPQNTHYVPGEINVIYRLAAMGQAYDAGFDANDLPEGWHNATVYVEAQTATDFDASVMLAGGEVSRVALGSVAAGSAGAGQANLPGGASVDGLAAMDAAALAAWGTPVDFDAARHYARTETTRANGSVALRAWVFSPGSKTLATAVYTVDENVYESTIQSAKQAALGGVAFHGLKTGEALDGILLGEYYLDFEAAQRVIMNSGASAAEKQRQLEELAALRELADALLFLRAANAALAVSGQMEAAAEAQMQTVWQALCLMADDMMAPLYEGELRVAFLYLQGAQAGAYARWIMDPSGYVYEAFPENRLEGVSATLYQQVAGEGSPQEVAWPAEEYDQENPQATGPDGAFAWDVPEGRWRVRFTKDGYQPAASEWLDVPPPHTEIAVGMVSTETPAVEWAVFYPDCVEVKFSQYMDVATLTAGNLALEDGQGGAIAVDVDIPEAHEDPDDPARNYADRVRLAPQNGTLDSHEGLKLTVTTGVKNYAGTALAAPFEKSGAAAPQPVSLAAASEEVRLAAGGQTSVTVTLEPAAAGVGRSLDATSSDDGVATVTATALADGRASLTITGVAPGDADITVALADSTLAAQVRVTVAVPGGAGVASATDIVVEPAQARMDVGGTLALSAYVRPYYAANKQVGWSSGDEKVATVDAAGKVTAHAAGAAVITATAADGGHTASCTVYVSPAFVGVRLSPASAVLVVKGTLEIEATLNLPEKADTALTWGTSNAAVATVDASGKVTAVKAGTATITAKAGGGRYSASCLVKVVPAAGEEGLVLSITKPPASLDVGKGVTLKHSLVPAGIPLEVFEWSWASTDGGEVSLNAATGKLVAKAPGTVKVTLTVRDLLGNEKKADCAIKVRQPAASVAIHNAQTPGEKLTGKQRMVPTGHQETAPATGADTRHDRNVWRLAAVTTTATGYPTNDEVVWSTSEDGKAAKDRLVTFKVEPDGTCVVTANSKGRVGTVTVTAKVSGKSAKVQLGIVIPAKKVAFAPGKGDAPVQNLAVGAKTTLAATAEGLNGAAPGNAGIAWRSADPRIATVSSGGVVQGKMRGTVKIYATAKDNPAVEAFCEVQVVAPITAIAFDQKAFTMAPGGEDIYPLSVTLNKGAPHGATATDLTWKLEGDAAGFVDKKGNPIRAGAHPADPATGLVYLKAADTITGDKQAVKVKVSGPAAENNYGYQPQSPTLTVTVRDMPMVRAASMVFAKAPTVGEDKPLGVNKTYTPSVKLLDKDKKAKVTNQNVQWRIEALDGDDPVDWRPFVRFEAASGKVTGLRASGDITLAVTGRAVFAEAGAGEATAVQYRFKVVELATAVKLSTQDGNTLNVSRYEEGRVVEDGGSITLTAAPAMPYEGVDPGVSWTVNNPKTPIVRFEADANSITLRGLRAGKVTVTAIARDAGKKKATYKITVTQQARDVIITNAANPAPGGELPALQLAAGKSLSLKALVNAETTVDAKDKVVKLHPAAGNKSVTWTAQEYPSKANPGKGTGSVVALNAKTGKVTAVGDGYALVKVVLRGPAESTLKQTDVLKHKNTNTPLYYSATIRIDVRVAVSRVAIRQKALAVYGGRTQPLRLDAITTPAQAELTAGEDALTWAVPANGPLTFVDAQGDEVPTTLDSKTNTRTYQAPAGQGEVYLAAKDPGKGNAVKATVAVSAGGKPAKVTVTVTGDKEKAPAATGVTLNRQVAWLQAGKSLTLTAAPNAGYDDAGKAIPAGNKNVSWAVYEADGITPHDGTVLTVNNAGRVTATGRGEALAPYIVRATADDGGAIAECQVFCVARP